MKYDVIIAGGGPAGLAAALALGRARKRVLLCDAGARRNAAAERVQNFVTRDGTPPDEFRRVGREQLQKYTSVEVRDVRVRAVRGSRSAFQIELTEGSVEARRLLLCTGMIDQLPPLAGFSELWGHSIFQCPYCHGFEVQDRRWAYLVRAADAPRFVTFAMKLRAWTRDVTLFTNGEVDVSDSDRDRLGSAGIRLETAAVVRLLRQGERLEAVELANAATVPCDVLFAHPPQRQVELVGALGLELDEEGCIRVEPMKRETSVAGVYAAGDATTRMQGAIFAAAMGTQAATMINTELTVELATSGAL